MRQSTITRNTKETRIQASLNIDGTGRCKIESGVGFLNHMLELFAYHGRFDIDLRCQGDIEVDGHHSAEDMGIVLGKAFDQALGDRRGITRYGQFILPMDDALVLTALDISGRPFLGFDVSLQNCKVGTLDTEVIEEFLNGFVRNLGLTLHIRQLAGHNTHHILEACFKGLGRALAQAAAADPRFGGEAPSSKGII